MKKLIIFQLFLLFTFVLVSCGGGKKPEPAPAPAPAKKLITKDLSKSKKINEELEDPHQSKREGLFVNAKGMKYNSRKMWDKHRNHWRKVNKCN